MEPHPKAAYSGHENLLVMQHARKYNHFLGSLIRQNNAGAGTVVDFGAGVGALAQGARAWARRLVCVEPDAVQMDILRKAGFEVAADLSALGDASVDFVYSINVLEHIAQDVEALAQIFSKLRPGGRLLVYVPALQWLYTSMDTAVGHVRRYHKEDLVQKLQSVGYNLTRSEYVDCLGVPATLAYKWLGNSSGHINLGALKTYDRFIFPLSRLLDRLFGGMGGKNLLVVCEKP
jgi:SAM-dependent methyltransferase